MKLIFGFFVFTEIDQEVDKLNKQQRDLQNKLEGEKRKESEYTEKINEDIKDLEKMTNKQSLLLKKVSIDNRFHPPIVNAFMVYVALVQ